MKLLFLFILIVLTAGQQINPTSDNKEEETPEGRDGRGFARYREPYTRNTYDRNTVRDVLLAYGATKYLKSLEKHGLTKYLDHPGLYTIFAPTNEAYDKLYKSPGCQQFINPIGLTLGNPYGSNSYRYFGRAFSVYSSLYPDEFDSLSPNYGKSFPAAWMGPGAPAPQSPAYTNKPYWTGPYKTPPRRGPASHSGYEPQGDYATLHNTLEHNIVLGKLTLKQLQYSDGFYLPSILGHPVTVTKYGNVIVVNGGRIIGADYHASNGIVHIVDAVYCMHSDSIANQLEKDFDYTHKRFVQTLSYINFRPYIHDGPYVTVIVPDYSELNTFFNSIKNLNVHQTVNRIIDLIRGRIISGFIFPVNFLHQKFVRSYDGTALAITKINDYEVSLNGVQILLNTVRLTKHGIIYGSRATSSYSASAAPMYPETKVAPAISTNFKAEESSYSSGSTSGTHSYDYVSTGPVLPSSYNIPQPNVNAYGGLDSQTSSLSEHSVDASFTTVDSYKGIETNYNEGIIAETSFQEQKHVEAHDSISESVGTLTY